MADLGVLKEIFSSPQEPGSFSGIGKLQQALKDKGVRLSQKQIKSWLAEQDTYTALRETKSVQERPHVIVYGKDQQWDADTANFVSWEKENDGFSYFLLCIDIFTRYVWTYPLKTLQGKEMQKALAHIFTRVKPQVLRTDRGSEFNNVFVQNFLRQQDVRHFTTLNEVKANYAERAIKTIKLKLSKYMYEKQTRKWFDQLENITQSYNLTRHRSLKLSPTQARSLSNQELWVHHYLSAQRSTRSRRSPKLTNTSFQRKKAFKFNIGDQVKISYLKRPFQRAYDQQFSGEIFTISERKRQQGIPVYKLKDFHNQEIQGQFYEAELQKVRVDENTVYKIEKVIKRQKNRLLVKWLGWPDSFNSWISKADVTRFQ